VEAVLVAVVAKAVVELSALNIKTITLHSTFTPFISRGTRLKKIQKSPFVIQD